MTPRLTGTATPAPGLERFTGAPNALAAHYRYFRVDERLLLTGHSHQAWPDVGLDAQKQAWLDAATHVDDKWEQAFVQAQRVREGYRALLGDAAGEITLGANTHELVVRFLSALPLRDRPRLVTTDGEFHTIRRQLDRLEEVGLEVVRVRVDPVDSLAERLALATNDRTSAVLASSVLFRSARRVPHLATVAEACARHGAEFLIDTYHQLNVVPSNLTADGLEGAFVVGGGYKYCQLGEGNCFLRVPPDCGLRPVVTGWFSEFTALAGAGATGVAYGKGPDRFAGSTYDPTSHYRAAAVFDFFSEQGLEPELLRRISQHQMGVLAEAVDGLDLDPTVIDRDRTVPLDALGGFLALQAPDAGELSGSLRRVGVFTDYRENVLRLGPAPYLTDEQLRDAVSLLGEAARDVSA